VRERERDGPPREREGDGLFERRGERRSLYGDGSTEKEREGQGLIGTVPMRERESGSLSEREDCSSTGTVPPIEMIGPSKSTYHVFE